MSRPIYYGSKTWATLVVLRAAGQTKPVSEADVWRALKKTRPTDNYGAALKRLVDLGFVERHGARGRYRYTITAAGQAYALMNGDSA